MTRAPLILALVVALAAGSAAAGERGELKRRAKAGDAVAMRALARDYHLGLHGWKRMRAAERWARSAIYAGDLDAELLLAQVLSRGDRGRLGDSACFWFLSAARQGAADAFVHAGDCLSSSRYFGRSNEPVFAEARGWYERAIAHGTKGVERRMFRLLDGRSSPSNAEKLQFRAEADAWRRRAAEAGDFDSQLELARGYRYGPEGPPAEREVSLYVRVPSSGPRKDELPLRFVVDLPQAVRWYEMAAAQGDLGAYAELGDLLLRGPEVADPARALPMLQAAAAKGSRLALRDLGDAYRQGLGTPIDRKQAQQWYLLAARRDEAESAWQRARYHLDPKGGAYSFRRARYWLLKATRQGHPRASERLAVMHLRGEGVEPDLKKGEDGLRKAANNGSEDAALLLMRLYLKGDVFARNVDDALEYAELAKNRTDASQRLAFGRMLLNGEGVARNLTAAKVWFGRGAELKDPASMAELAALFEDGRGGHSYTGLAAHWFKLAAEAGYGPAQRRYAAMLAAGRGVARDEAAAAAWDARADQAGVPRATLRRPPGAELDRVLAGEGSVAYLVWEGNTWDGGAIEQRVLDAPRRGALRAEFEMSGAGEGLTAESSVGIEVEGTVFERVIVHWVAAPVPKRFVGARPFELVVEHRVGDVVKQRIVLASESTWRASAWAEIGWDEEGHVLVRVDDFPQLSFVLETPRVLSAAGRIEGARGEFTSMTVE